MAFTLAEVLITLGIIGVVAAMTMPVLLAKHQETVLVKAAKKSYSTILNSVNLWLSNNGSIGDYEAYFTCARNECIDRLAENLQIVSVCYNSSQMNKCGGVYDVREYKKLNAGNGNTQSNNHINRSRIVLKDGTYVSIFSEVYDGSCRHPYWFYEKDENGNNIPDPSSPNGYKGETKYSNTCGWIIFDTNGLKGPNQVGKDAFLLPFWSNSLSTGLSSDAYGNINYVLLNDKLIETENYKTGSF